MQVVSVKYACSFLTFRLSTEEEPDGSEAWVIGLTAWAMGLVMMKDLQQHSRHFA